MPASWFFATTPIPQRPQVAVGRSHATLRAGRRWWQRLTERYVSWGERSAQRRLPPWMY
jgi:hypothetical protein